MAEYYYPEGPNEISVTEPIGSAYVATKQILFKPFDLGKWFLLGFCAFLANLCDCGGPHGNGGNNNSTRGFRSFGDAKEYFIDWFYEYWELILSIGWLFAVGLLMLTVLLLWLSSRGKFMLLDGVVRNRGAVVEPWRKFKDLANSLFLWRFILSLVSLVSLGLIVAVSLKIAWPDIQAERFDSNAIWALIIGIPLWFIGIIFFSVLGHILDDFVAPIMYKRNILGGEAIGIFRREILADRGGTFMLFYLMKFLLGFAAGILLFLAGLLTCCIGCILMIIPFIGSVVTLPVAVFFRTYSLYFLKQFGPEWELMGRPENIGLELE